MTNEQLAELIGQGGNDELLPLLWEKMRKLYILWSGKYYTAHKERCDLCGITADDIRQESYLSMLEAVKAYTSRSDEHRETLFSTFCHFPFKKHATKLIGMHTSRTRNEPLNQHITSLDNPLTDKNGETDDTLLTLIPDNEAEQPFRDIENADYSRLIRETVAEELKENPKELDVIERRYYNGETLTQIAADYEVTHERIRQIEYKALRRLRKSKAIRNFQEISCYKHVSISSYQRTHISAVEKVVEERERKQKEINDYIANKLKAQKDYLNRLMAEKERTDRHIAEMDKEREKRLAERWAKRHPERNKAENIKNT